MTQFAVKWQTDRAYKPVKLWDNRRMFAYKANADKFAHRLKVMPAKFTNTKTSHIRVVKVTK